MPVYEYLCEYCGDFTARRSVSERNAPCLCPGCGAAAVRVTITAPTLATMPAWQRSAHAGNERSAHAPYKCDEYRAAHGHGSGCSCCNGARASSATTTADGAKSFPGTRPWMISH